MSDVLKQIDRLMLSGKKADIQKIQRLLKARGLYADKIDGISRKGTNDAISALRSQIRADQKRAAAVATEKLKLETAEKKRLADAEKFKQSEKKRKAKEKRENEIRQQKQTDALVSVGFTGASIVTSVAFGKGEVKKMNNLDAVAVRAKNTQLKKYASQIEKIQNSTAKVNKTKAGNLTASAKRQIGAIAKEAKVQGVTKFKAPIGLTNGTLLAGKGVLLSVAASQMDNQYAKDGLNAVASGLYLAGAGVPAARYTMTKFGVNPLDGKALSKISEAKALAKSTVKNTKAVKAASRATVAVASTKTAKTVAKVGGNVVAFTGLKTAARFAGPIGVALTAGFAAYASYDAYRRTGSFKAAGEAGLDSVTLGGYSLAKKYLASDSKTAKKAVAKPVKAAALKAPAVRSLQQSVKGSPIKASVKPKKLEVSSVTRQRQMSKGRVKGHYRNTKGGRVWIAAHSRAA